MSGNQPNYSLNDEQEACIYSIKTICEQRIEECKRLASDVMLMDEKKVEIEITISLGSGNNIESTMSLTSENVSEVLDQNIVFYRDLLSHIKSMGDTLENASEFSVGSLYVKLKLKANTENMKIDNLVVYQANDLKKILKHMRQINEKGFGKPIERVKRLIRIGLERENIYSEYTLMKEMSANMRNKGFIFSDIEKAIEMFLGIESSLKDSTSEKMLAAHCKQINSLISQSERTVRQTADDCNVFFELTKKYAKEMLDFFGVYDLDNIPRYIDKLTYKNGRKFGECFGLLQGTRDRSTEMAEFIAAKFKQSQVMVKAFLLVADDRPIQPVQVIMFFAKMQEISRIKDKIQKQLSADTSELYVFFRPKYGVALDKPASNTINQESEEETEEVMPIKLPKGKSKVLEHTPTKYKRKLESVSTASVESHDEGTNDAEQDFRFEFDHRYIHLLSKFTDNKTFSESTFKSQDIFDLAGKLPCDSAETKKGFIFIAQVSCNSDHRKHIFGMHRQHSKEFNKGIAEAFRDWLLENGFTVENILLPEPQISTSKPKAKLF